ncbi:MAG: extracellular solute-binding protein [Firmicutes bacterium]|nr:extracellular solute-binding protein [Bacillota bacterium]
MLLVTATACSSGKNGASSSQVVIYCNSDDEAIEAMKKTLDDSGYKGKYAIQTFGTTELGGKLLAEGKNIEADMVVMSSFYVDSAQEKNDMFAPLEIAKKPLAEYPDYYRPLLANQGAIFYNTEEVKNDNLPLPASLKDLTKPEYKGKLSVTDISGSSTAWLMIQALVDAYGEDGASKVLAAMYQNAGDNLEESGSAPIKKVLAGEAAIGFGLRHQAVKAKNEGKPIDFIDPTEGNFTLTEGVAVVDKKDDAKKQQAQEIANLLVDKSRAELQTYYPLALYDGETTDPDNIGQYSKEFKEPLTVDLLKKHMQLSEDAKK